MKSNSYLLCKRINDMISSNPCMTLPKLAQLSGINRWKIENILREQLGYGFRELNNRARLNSIMPFLIDDNARIAIKDIACKMGISPNALSRFIHSMTGKSARELRDSKFIQKKLA
jgi:AraC-like DNA-binding protein